MFDFDKAEFEEVIAKHIPQSKRALITSALDSSEQYLEILGQQLSGDSATNTFMVVTARRTASTTSVWQAVKSEIFDFFCTESASYTKERKGGESVLNKTIHAITLIVATKFHIGLAVVSPIVTIGLMLALKVGKNVWCDLSGYPAASS
ncbi:hypothetical protein [Pseudomonas sp. CFBP 13719]|uniref:hypothetical protein n=1 Tax=Pseudomonas sp. CFBP 13719 TaxID=2775303 RepID=UPI0017872760|nr:hypothetical protein [Pseudomonas sp. CFBP 13719]MBD8682802.1 hypothetical protein [Pseudomonas sp. CFBP 13719]